MEPKTLIWACSLEPPLRHIGFSASLSPSSQQEQQEECGIARDTRAIKAKVAGTDTQGGRLAIVRRASGFNGSQYDEGRRLDESLKHVSS